MLDPAGLGVDLRQLLLRPTAGWPLSSNSIARVLVVP
jgi:hypothetical protein